MPATTALDKRSTGMVRKIDDLGRIVIPIEIRRNMRLRKGDPLEIFTMGETLCFEKYSFIATLEDIAKRTAKTIYKQFKMPVAICDTEKFIVTHGDKYLKGKLLSPALYNRLKNSQHYARSKKDGEDIFVQATEDGDRTIAVIASSPITINSNFCGALCLVVDMDQGPWPVATPGQIAVVRAFASSMSDELSD